MILLSPPLSYPLPLLSLTTHLALLSTKLPRLISKDEEDPMFDDDWDAAEYLYPRGKQTQHLFRPPISLLVISVGENTIFDPSREEIAVADAVFCVSVARNDWKTNDPQAGNLKLLAIRTIDPPSRMTHPGVPDSVSAVATGLDGAAAAAAAAGVGGGGQNQNQSGDSSASPDSIWSARRGGVKRGIISRIVKMVLERGGVGDEVMEGLEMVEVE